MAYKPLSQTVTNGKDKEIASSDAIFDKIATDIAAIPASANRSLSNLTSPTAVNQDLLLAAGNKIRLNASETVNTLLHVKSPAAVGTGVNAVTPLNTGSTTFSTSASISAILSVGDYIKLNGLADIARVTVINSSTQITVSPSLGIGGNGTSREIEKIQTSATFRDASNVEQFSIVDGKFKFSSNILMGEGAGDKLTGTNTVIIGQGAGRALTTGASNTIIGASAASAFTGSTAIAIGVSTPAANDSVGIGNSITIGVQSVIIGHGAKGGNGADNVTIGRNAAASLTSGAANVLIGSNVASGTTGVTDAIYIGVDAGGGNAQTGSISIGRSAGRTNGLGNVAVGASALTTTGTGNQNTALGYQSLTLLTTGTSNIGLGYTAGDAITTGSNNVLIGDVAGASTLQSTVIMAAGSTERFRIDTQGNMGLGITTPVDQLDINGGLKIRGNLDISTIGNGIKIATGSNATAGLAVIPNGDPDVTVSTNACGDDSLILVTNNTSDAHVSVSSKALGSFKIDHGANVTGNQSCAWFIINPAEPEAVAFMIAASITDGTQKSALQDLVFNLKAAKLWTKMQAIYPFVGGTNTAHSYNLKDTTQYQITWNGTVTHDANGITGNGTDGYGNTNFPGSSLAQNNTHISIYSRTNSGANVTDIGYAQPAGNGTTWLQARRTSNLARWGMNANGYFEASVANSQGLFVGNRVTSANFELYKNNALVLVTPGFNSIDLSTHTTTLGIAARNSNGSFIEHSNRNYSFASIGSGFTALEISRFYDIIQAFQTALGRNV